MNIHDLPFELFLIILERLDEGSLLAAEQVNLYWKEACHSLWLLQYKNSWAELQIEAEENGQDFVDFGKKRCREKVLVQKGYNVKFFTLPEVAKNFYENVGVFAKFGELVFFDVFSGTEKVFHGPKKEIDYSVKRLITVHILNTLIVIYEDEAVCYNLSKDLKEIFSLNTIKKNNYFKHFYITRVYENKIIAIPDNAIPQILIYDVKRNEEGVSITQTNQITSDVRIIEACIWNGKLTYLKTTGEVVQKCLNTLETLLETEAFVEIKYHNPLWTYRGWIFCSTINTHTLLGYWHMDRDLNYWLIGKPETGFIKSKNFNRVSTICSIDVTCLYLSGRLVFCGTSKGQLLVYYLSDKFFIQPDIEVEFNRDSDLTIDASENAISNIKVEDYADGWIIYILPYFKRETICIKMSIKLQ